MFSLIHPSVCFLPQAGQQAVIPVPSACPTAPESCHCSPWHTAPAS